MGVLREGFLSRLARNPKAEMPFLEHLEELRWRILWSLVAIVVGFVAGLAVVHYLDVMVFLIQPAREIFGSDWKLITLAPTDQFFMFLKVSLSLGIVLASPIIIYQVWSFLAPAMEKHEKRAIVPALYLGLVLFAAGVAMAYFIALPISLRFLVGFQTEFMEPSYTATGYLGFVVKLLLGFGIVFELPVVVLVLSALGLVTPAFLRAKRRHAIVAITVVAAMLSPGDVIVVTFLMMVPLYFLYEFSIVLSVMMWRRREEREREIGTATPPAESVAVDVAGPVGSERPEPTPYDHGDPARESEPGGAGAPDPDDGKPSAPDGEG